MCGTRGAWSRSTGPREEAEPAAALLALLEEELHAEADAEHRAGRRDALAQGVGEPAASSSRAAALGVADAGDHRERRLAHDGRVGVTARLCAGAREAGADAAQVARAVVGEDDSQRALRRAGRRPFAHASRSARPSALNAASATWWSSSPRGLDVQREPGLHREALERVREERDARARRRGRP